MRRYLAGSGAQAKNDGRATSDGAGSAEALWKRYSKHLWAGDEIGVTVDVSRVRFDDGYLARMRPQVDRAMDAMAALEAGAISNPGEGRMVGHYWLRAPELSPSDEIAAEIRAAVGAVDRFARQVREGAVQGAHGPFEHLVHVGIGGSALGPQLVCEVLGGPTDRIQVHFLDNVDPDGVDRVLARLDGALGRTLVSVVSKSGITPTPNQVTAELEVAYRAAGLHFARHAIATSVAGTLVDERAERERWLARFPMWDWVGGRTSVTSAVGLVPLALMGADGGSLLRGAAAMDRLTRERDLARNPASLMAAMWYWLGDGRGSRAMVLVPYRERLALLPRYVQQLVMESVGKRLDRSGATVRQGLTVYGNKGSTDQHAYFQQLRDGTDDFFVTFVGAGQARRRAREVEPGLSLADFLFGSLEGSRNALYERGRDSITITLSQLDAGTLGALLALFERTVGIYAELIDVNAYDQPGVDKFTAAPVAALQAAVLAHVRGSSRAESADEIAVAISRGREVETVYKLLDRLAAEAGWGVSREPAAGRCTDRFFATATGPDADTGPQS